jgi:hypothetical protein
MCHIFNEKQKVPNGGFILYNPNFKFLYRTQRKHVLGPKKLLVLVWPYVNIVEARGILGATTV